MKAITKKDYTILRNPTAKQLMAAELKSFNMRGLVTETGDTFWWGASNDIHQTAGMLLGIDGNYHDIFTGVARLYLVGNHIEVASGWLTVERSKSMRKIVDNGFNAEDSKGNLTFDEYIASMKHAYKDFFRMAEKMIDRPGKIFYNSLGG